MGDRDAETGTIPGPPRSAEELELNTAQEHRREARSCTLEM